MKVLLIYFKNNESILDNFIENCLDYEIISKKIILNECINLKYYFNEFINYDYILYLDDNLILKKKIIIKSYIDILIKKNIEQIFLCSNKSKYYLKKDNLIFTDFKKYNFNTVNHLESSLTILENSNILNYKNKNNTGVDYFEYIDNDNINWPHFKLLPSIIKSEIFEKLNNFNLEMSYFDRTFSLEYVKYFTSAYLDNEICEIKENNFNKSDPNNMTLVTGFINIPNENKKIKTHCVKKNIYNYLDKSIPTLKIKQNMIIYIPENLYTHVYEIRKNLNLLNKTKIIIINDNYLYMNEYLDNIKINCLKNIETYKNHYYISAVSTRYNFLKDAIKNNYFNTEYTTWIDFGASHCIDINDDTLFKYNKNKFRIAWIARFDKKNNNFKYNHYVLGGGIFGGKNNILKKVCDLHDKIFLDNMKLGYNCNDDKTLWFIFEQYPELFDTYFSGYSNLANKY